MTTTEYHRLAATGTPRWWRPVLATLAVLFALVVGQVLLFGVAWIGAAAAGLPDLPDGLNTAVTLGSIALALPIVLVAARLLQHRPAGTLSSVVGRLRWGWLARCLILTVPAIALAFVCAVALLALTTSGTGTPGSLDAGTLVAGSVMLVALVPLQAAAEEYLFRGWLLQAVGSCVRSPWPAIGVQALLFALAHGVGTPWGFIDLLAFGGILGWLAVRTGGLESGIALHAANNLTWTLLAALSGSLALDSTAADMPWQLVVGNLLSLGGYAAAVSWLARRRGVLVVAASTSAPSPTTVSVAVGPNT